MPGVAETKRTWFHMRHEFLEAHGAVVEGGGEAEAVIDEGFLAVAVAGVHGVDLRDGDVGFVDDEQIILGEIIDEGVGFGAGGRAGEVAGVVFDAGAHAGFVEHFDVVLGAGEEALGFEEFALHAEFFDALFEFGLDVVDGADEIVFVGDVVFGGEDEDLGFFGEQFAGGGVDVPDGFDIVAEHFDADRRWFRRRGRFRRRRRGRGRCRV